MYGNDARAGPHSRPLKDARQNPAPAAPKYCPASGALTKRPPRFAEHWRQRPAVRRAQRRGRQKVSEDGGGRGLLLRDTMGCPRVSGGSDRQAGRGRICITSCGAPGRRTRAPPSPRPAPGPQLSRGWAPPHPAGSRPHRRLKAATVYRSRTGLESWREQKGWWFCCLVPPRQHCD